MPRPEAPGRPAPEDPAPEDTSTPGRRGFTPLRVLGVSVMLAIALFWIWAFSESMRQRDEPANVRNPDFLEDRAWVEEAEETCAATMAAVDERAADAGRQDRAARADAIDAGTDDLRTMVDALASPLPGPAADRAVVEPWLADWEQLLADRDTYAATVREDADARFLTTEKFNDPLDRVIEIFADVNDMPSCGPAGDVG